MAEPRQITATALDLQRLRVLLQTGEPAASPAASPAGGVEMGESIIVELIDDLPEEDYELHTAQQVRIIAGEWEALEEVQIRKVTYPLISAGSSAIPVRLIAEPVGNLGYCVQRIAGEAESSAGVADVECCGCEDPDTFPRYNFGEGDVPLYLIFYHPELSCCESGTGGFTRLSRIDKSWTDSSDVVWSDSYLDHWVGMTDVICGVGESIEWKLQTAGGSAPDLLTATHSVDGLVARYLRDSTDNDLFCGARYYLDESATPARSRDCTICGLTLCLRPSRGEPITEMDDCYKCGFTSCVPRLRQGAAFMLPYAAGDPQPTDAEIADGVKVRSIFSEFPDAYLMRHRRYYEDPAYVNYDADALNNWCERILIRGDTELFGGFTRPGTNKILCGWMEAYPYHTYPTTAYMDTEDCRMAIFQSLDTYYDDQAFWVVSAVQTTDYPSLKYVDCLALDQDDHAGGYLNSAFPDRDPPVAGFAPCENEGLLSGGGDRVGGIVPNLKWWDHYPEGVASGHPEPNHLWRPLGTNTASDYVYASHPHDPEDEFWDARIRIDVEVIAL